MVNLEEPVDPHLSLDANYWTVGGSRRERGERANTTRSSYEVAPPCCRNWVASGGNMHKEEDTQRV